MENDKKFQIAYFKYKQDLGHYKLVDQEVRALEACLYKIFQVPVRGILKKYHKKNAREKYIAVSIGQFQFLFIHTYNLDEPTNKRLVLQNIIILHDIVELGLYNYMRLE